MSADADLIKLYSQRILGLAADMPRTGRLDAPSVTMRKRSPVCGSTVTVDLVVDAEGRITDYAQDVKACALGQAAAAVVGANVVGLGIAEIRKGRDELRAMLKSDGPVPAPPFDGLEVLEPARDYKNRHASIMLTLEATLAALEEHAAG